MLYEQWRFHDARWNSTSAEQNQDDRSGACSLTAPDAGHGSPARIRDKASCPDALAMTGSKRVVFAARLRGVFHTLGHQDTRNAQITMR